MKRLISTAVAAVILAGGALVAPAASAAPPPTPPAGQQQAAKVKYKTVKVSFSKIELTGLRLATKALKSDTSGSKLDWRKTKKTFGAHTSLRSGFGAGWWSRRRDWGQFTHMSRADKVYIVKWAKTHAGPNPTLISPLRQQRAPIPCTGVTKFTPHNPDYLSEQWYNSCDTDTVKADMDVCMPTAGAIAAIAAVVGKSGTVAVGAALVGLGCGVVRIYVGYAQARSDLNAVKIYTLPRRGITDANPTTYFKVKPQ